MYIKWIVCEVKNNLKEEFSSAQEKWIETKNSEGFIGQVGGFDLNNKTDACIISFWENDDALNIFMNKFHNKIFFNNNQSDYYNSIKIDFFNPILTMEGEFQFLGDFLEKGKILRIADCFVKSNKTNHLEFAQNEVWVPCMKNSTGMLGGMFSKDVNNSPHYLVSTFWDSLENHESYVEKVLPRLQEKSQVKNDITKITGRKIKLIDSWKIIKNSTVNL